MQNKESIRDLDRNNYVPKNTEVHLVHYKAERPQFDRTTGERISKAELIKTPVKLFDMVKKQLELQGMMVEVIYHPEGKYNVVDKQISPSEMLSEKEREYKELAAKLAEMEAKLIASEKKAQDAEMKLAAKEPVYIFEESPKEETKKPGRPSKK